MRFAALVIVLLSSTHAAFGQTGGTITGVITDPAGAVVPNAPVEAKNTGTGVVSSVATSATGNFTLSDLPAGAYEVNVTVTGFKKYVLTGITVEQLQTARVDVTLVVGSASESITINDAAPLLKTETGDISHNVTTDTQDALPMGQIGAIRVSTQVVLTIPGVNGGLTSIAINGSPAASELPTMLTCSSLYPSASLPAAIAAWPWQCWPG